MTTIDEFDQLLRDRFNLDRDDLVAALRALPAHRPWAAQLTAGETRILDAAGLTEDPDAYAETAADVTANMARLYSTSFTAGDVATGLGVNPSRVRQRRLNHTIWAIDDGGTWAFPSLQFEQIIRNGSHQLKLVRGLDRVLPNLLQQGLHPAAVANFLLTPQPELRVDGQPKSVKDWLLQGESVEPVLSLVEVGDWAGA